MVDYAGVYTVTVYVKYGLQLTTPVAEAIPVWQRAYLLQRLRNRDIKYVNEVNRYMSI